MEVELDLIISLEENAGNYFDLAKKAKKKLQGAQEALQQTRRKLEQLQREETTFLEQEKKKMEQKAARASQKKEWYEKFHWFISSEGFLCIGGKDATSNEIIIKKHMEKEDIVFHTDMAGSPFFIIKHGKDAGEATLQETAQATAIYSRAWKLGHTTADIFYVLPEQVSKEAPAGEYMSKGSFMIRGKSTYLHPKLEGAIGLVEGRVIGGPVQAVQKRCSTFVVVIPGDMKKSDVAKKIKAKLKGGDLDDIITFLPAGGGGIKK